MKTRMRPAVAALAELAILFAPAIPAYIWVWPNVSGTREDIFQVLVYVYLLAGGLIIGLRRWRPDALGLNRRGLGVSLACGGVGLVILILGRLAAGLPWNPRPLTWERLAWELFFYFCMVGLTEELLARGLLYRALYELRGDRLAIWGSAIAFGFYHIGSQGPLGVLATGLIGAFWGAIRWRAGGIAGLIVIHGLYDIIAIEGWPDLRAESVSRISSLNPVLALICDGLLAATILYLWKLHPLVERMRTNNPQEGAAPLG
jgi:membrane protease YdiL (CAAX protease family)